MSWRISIFLFIPTFQRKWINCVFRPSNEQQKKYGITHLCTFARALHCSVQFGLVRFFWSCNSICLGSIPLMGDDWCRHCFDFSNHYYIYHNYCCCCCFVLPLTVRAIIIMSNLELFLNRLNIFINIFDSFRKCQTGKTTTAAATASCFR